MTEGKTMKAKSILLVDDDPTTREEARRELCDRFDVTEATNGLDAVRELHQRNFDCVIVDLTLPFVSAYEILRRVGTKTPATARVALSTASREQLRVFDGGLADAVVQKVHDMSRIAGIVAAVA